MNRNVVDRKILNEMTIAAVIGIMIGFTVGFVSATEFGLKLWLSLSIGCVVGPIVAGISYCPGEAYRVVLAVCKEWRDFLPSWKLLKSNINVAFGEIKGYVFMVGVIVYVVLSAAAFVVVSRFTVGFISGHWPTKGQGSPWDPFPAIGISCLFLIIVLLGGIATEKLKPTWKMPISIRIFKCIWQLTGIIDTFNSKQNYVFGAVFATFIAPVALLATPVILSILVVDFVATIALALSSTERLSVMFGAFVGTLVGLSCYFLGLCHYGLAAVAIGSVIGGYTSRWTYALRCKLSNLPMPGECVTLT